MTATGHAVIGTVIAAKFSNPALAIPLAIASHLAADSFPHWDVATNIRKKGRLRVLIEAFLDVIVGFILSYLLISSLFTDTNITYAIFMIFMAQLFDWLMAPYYFFDIQWFKWAYDFQKKFDNVQNKPWGIINQVGILILLLLLAKIF